jgi:hypothetical protein
MIPQQPAFSIFESITKEADEICCPSIKRVLKHAPKEPWFTRGLLKSRMTKEKLHKKAVKGNESHWLKYKTFHNNYNRAIPAAKLLYYAHNLAKSKVNGKHTWLLAREVTGYKENKGSSGMGPIHNCKNTRDKANALLTFM